MTSDEEVAMDHASTDAYPDRVSTTKNDDSDDSSLSPHPVAPDEGGNRLPTAAAITATTPAEVQGTTIGVLVAKSKRAASSLWTLLHAKNCRLGVNRCTHPGCAEAKLMFLHLKTCPAGPLDPCPSGRKGCQDARKLLAHYRRCRDIRARQAQNPTTSQQQQQQQQHVCLVCSLVARHAKFTLERGSVGLNRSNSPRGGLSSKSYNIPSLNLTCDSIAEHAPEQFSLSQSFEENKGYLSQQMLSGEPSQPRFAFSRGGGGVGENRSSPPSGGFSALLAASSSSVVAGTTPMASSQTDALYELGVANNSAMYGRNGSIKNGSVFQRPRADSLPPAPASLPPPDQEPPPQSQQQLQPQQGEKSMSYLYLAAVDSLAVEQASPMPPQVQQPPSPQTAHMQAARKQRRRRSDTWSSGSAVSGVVMSNYDPLLQKPMGDELDCVLGGET